MWKEAINSGVATGRNGKGILYFWSAGNGAWCYDYFHVLTHCDNSNYDGFANYHNVMAIAAAKANGEQAFYSELGANILITGYGGVNCDSLAITSTDLIGSNGYNTGAEASDLSNTDYTQCFNGTSAAAPTASGVAALVLQANPDLSWRDVRRILAITARQNDISDRDWTTNGAGYQVNHKYGFGILDAKAAVDAAKSWINLPPQETYTTPLRTVNLEIPDANYTGLIDSVTVSGSGISDLESVVIEFSAADHRHSGDLSVILISPTGTQSVLAEKHPCWGGEDLGENCIEFDAWTFSSVRHMGEAADGTWSLWVSDRWAVDTGTFQSWRLTFYGN
jgi:subtilisin-like proprotein convertase family protein